MTIRNRFVAALIAVTLAGNAAAQGGPVTVLEDPRRQPVLRESDAGPADVRFFREVISGLSVGGRDGLSRYHQPSAYQLLSAGNHGHASPKVHESMTTRTQPLHATPKLAVAASWGMPIETSPGIAPSLKR